MSTATILHDSTAGLAAVRREIADACATAGRRPEEAARAAAEVGREARAAAGVPRRAAPA